MIAGFFHQGSGLGNQIFRYITVRTLAENKGFDWGMVYQPDGSGKQEGFKGTFFTEQPRIIDAPSFRLLKDRLVSQWTEKKVVENGVDIRGYDPEINFVEDNTLIEGEFQDMRYWGHRLHDIDHWLRVEPYFIEPDVCLLGFRGGEYAVYPDLFLTKEYWEEAMKNSGYSKFEVHTDDPVLAGKFFPDFPIIADMASNWRAMRCARAAIISNSSFYIIPRLLNGGMTIAPRYWARHNIKTWALPQNYYPCFRYI